MPAATAAAVPAGPDRDEIFERAGQLMEGAFDLDPSAVAPAPSASPTTNGQTHHNLPAVRFGHIITMSDQPTKAEPSIAPCTTSATPAATLAVPVREKSRMFKSQATVNNLMTLSFTGSVATVNAPQVDFSGAVKATRKRLNEISRRTINPRSRAIRVWDTLTVLALLYTAFVTPFEVGFSTNSGGPTEAPVNFAFNRIIDTVFGCDVVLNFYLPYRESHRKGGMMVYDNKKIARAVRAAAEH